MSFEKDTGRDLYFAQLEKELAELIDPATGFLSAKYSRPVDCPLCAAKKSGEIFSKRGYIFVRCEGCGLIYANPQVVPELVQKNYRDESSSTELWMRVLLNQNERSWRGGYYAGILERLENEVGVGRVLDVGCAVGHFLTLARDRGWQPVGLELSTTALKHCRETLGLEVHDKTLSECDLAPESFDAVTLLGVLEHVPDPVAVLQDACRFLKPGGILSLVVPNAYSFLNMFLREKAATFDGRNHLIYFSSDNVTLCARKAGYEILGVDTVLTGLDNVLRYVQFEAPYGESRGTKFLPEALCPFAETAEGRARLEKFILDAGLGLRLRLFARKP